MTRFLTSLLLLFNFVLIINLPVYPDDQFKPWNSDVTIADENIFHN